jgi:hypothetical protein
MTDFTPDIRVMYLPPNSDHGDVKTEITSWVDYNINITRGTSEFINPPYPGSCKLSLLFDEDIVPDIELGSWVQIEVINGALGYEVLHAGNVTNRTSSYRSYGLTGFVLEWQFEITSAISLLQNTNYYVDTYTESTADGFVAFIADASTAFNWFALNRNLTWADYGPATWAEVDTTRLYDFPAINYGSSAIDQALDEGSRNTWADLVTITYGVYGWIIERPYGELDFYYGNLPLTSDLTFTADMLSPELVGGDRFDTLRNQITITKFDAVQTTYYENESVALYGDRSGTLDTYILNQSDVNDVGQRILNSMAYPLLSTDQISVNLLNPIFTDAQRSLLLFEPLGHRVTVQAPAPMGGTQDYLTIGLNYTINKDTFILDLTLAPISQAFSSINWDQVPYNYTWTSYGVAFPTQEWIDL